MIKVLIVDDHGVVRAGLEQLVGSFEGVEVVGAVAGGEEAVGAVLTRSPDVVLMDLEMPVMDGIEATRQIVESGSSARVVILTSFSDRPRILRALDSGAVGYLLKDSEPGDLRRGIEAAFRGESPLDPKAASALLDVRGRGVPAVELTDREIEVLKLLGEGMANKEIARRLGISEKTVKAHLTSVFRRIGVTDRTQAALWAERTGFLSR